LVPVRNCSDCSEFATFRIVCCPMVARRGTSTARMNDGRDGRMKPIELLRRDVAASAAALGKASPAVMMRRNCRWYGRQPEHCPGDNSRIGHCPIAECAAIPDAGSAPGRWHRRLAAGGAGDEARIASWLPWHPPRGRSERRMLSRAKVPLVTAGYFMRDGHAVPVRASDRPGTEKLI
jgi:hypothetical protein